jgi:CRP/FNR family transcriptional regulator, cyclic AMP receptor protein
MISLSLLKIPTKELVCLRVVHHGPAFGELFIAHLLVRNSKVEEDLVDRLFNSSEKRLARTLLMLANFGKADGP